MTLKKQLSGIALSLLLLAFKPSALATESPRIITLSPHMTEMVYDLGLEEQLVATDDASNYPDEVKTIAKVGSGLNPNHELLLLYRPDILLHFTPNSGLEDLFPNKNIELISSQPNSIPALFDDWHNTLTRAQQDEKKRIEIEEKIATLELEWQTLVANYKNKAPKKVFFLISDQPLFSLSDHSFLGQSIKSCHIENIFGAIEQASFIVDPEGLLLNQPDIVIHGYNATIPEGKERSRQSTLTLFKNIGIQLDAEQLVSVDVDVLHRPTLRFIKALPQICEAIHGE